MHLKRFDALANVFELPPGEGKIFFLWYNLEYFEKECVMVEKSESKTTIRRVDHTSKFTVFGNKETQDEGKTYEAVGMLHALLSRPPNWEVILSALERPGCGRDKVRRIIRELKGLGYIVRVQLRDGRGRMAGVRYDVYEDPQMQPETEKPSSDEPSADEPSPDNRQLQKNDSFSLQKRFWEYCIKMTMTKEVSPSSLSFEIFGSEAESLISQYGFDRVEDCCLHACLKASSVPERSGYAIRALQFKWNLGAVPVPVREKVDEWVLLARQVERENS